MLHAKRREGQIPLPFFTNEFLGAENPNTSPEIKMPQYWDVPSQLIFFCVCVYVFGVCVSFK